MGIPHVKRRVLAARPAAAGILSCVARGQLSQLVDNELSLRAAGFLKVFPLILILIAHSTWSQALWALQVSTVNFW